MCGRHDSSKCVLCVIPRCDMTHSCVAWLIHMHDMTHSCVTWLIHMHDMTHPCMCPCALEPSNKTYLVCVWRDSFICVTCLIRRCDMTHSCMTWHIHMRDITDSFMCTCALVPLNKPYLVCVWRDSFIRVTCLICRCDVTHSCVIWLIYLCDMTRSCMCACTLIPSYNLVCVTWRIHTCDVPHTYVCHILHIHLICLIHMYASGMGWLRSVGSIKS